MSLNLFKPLACGRMISVTGEDLWVLVKCKKLPNFCFRCGCIIHEEGGSKSKELKLSKQFETWLRAEAQRWPWLRKGERDLNNQRSKVNIGTPAEGEPLDSSVIAMAPEEDLN